MICLVYFSTCGEALEIADKMNAKSVLLTHFSQRYAKLPIMKTNTPVAVAFDHMRVCSSIIFSYIHSSIRLFINLCM